MHQFTIRVKWRKYIRIYKEPSGCQGKVGQLDVMIKGAHCLGKGSSSYQGKCD